MLFHCSLSSYRIKNMMVKCPLKGMGHGFFVIILIWSLRFTYNICESRSLQLDHSHKRWSWLLHSKKFLDVSIKICVKYGKKHKCWVKNLINPTVAFVHFCPNSTTQYFLECVPPGCDYKTQSPCWGKSMDFEEFHFHNSPLQPHSISTLWCSL